MNSRRRRVENLERRIAPAAPPGPPPPPSLVCVSTEGIILDDGALETQVYVGKHYTELPTPCKLLVGVDPVAALGLDLLPVSNPRHRSKSVGGYLARAAASTPEAAESADRLLDEM